MAFRCIWIIVAALFNGIHDYLGIYLILSFGWTVGCFAEEISHPLQVFQNDRRLLFVNKYMPKLQSVVIVKSVYIL